MNSQDDAAKENQRGRNPGRTGDRHSCDDDRRNEGTGDRGGAGNNAENGARISGLFKGKIRADNAERKRAQNSRVQGKEEVNEQ